MGVVDQRGITLVELSVALMLLSVALVGLAASFPYAMYTVVAGGYQTTATLLAQQSIEQARATAYASLSTLATGGSPCTPSSGTYAAVTGYAGFTRCVYVVDNDPDPTNPAALPKTTTVTVVARFSGVGGIGAGTIYDTTLATIFAK